MTIYTFTTLPAGTVYNTALGINGAGQIVGSYVDSSNVTHGYLYSLGTYAGPYDDPFAANGTFNYGLNASQIVGYYVDSSNISHGFLLGNGAWTTLNDPLAAGSGGTFATGINDTGQIVGYYWDSNYVAHGFLLTITPNPPPPPGGTTADMILRHGSDGLYEIYDIGNNAILAGYLLGQVETDWRFFGLGRFNGSDTTDMMLRNSNSGTFEVYDISNNNITNAASLGTVGLTWWVAGFG